MKKSYGELNIRCRSSAVTTGSYTTALNLQCPILLPMIPGVGESDYHAIDKGITIVDDRVVGADDPQLISSQTLPSQLKKKTSSNF